MWLRSCPRVRYRLPCRGHGNCDTRAIRTRDPPPPQRRWIRGRHGRQSYELQTYALAPTGLTAAEALAVSPWRWKVARLFFDLQEVWNPHRCYLTSPTGVARRVYAATSVHTACRVAKGAGQWPQGLFRERCRRRHLSPAWLVPL
jgi:hypothetical protein